MPGAEPIGEAEASAAFTALTRHVSILVAVSGGPDSVALMGLLRRWASAAGAAPLLHVATVDHGLRSTSGAEAAAVARQASSLGLPCEILRWDGPHPKTRIQERAREARYALLEDAARRIGADAVATAHHRDDQAETVLQRLLHGSGPSGLSGMRACRPLGARLELVRPCLRWPKERLVATAQALGLSFVRDSSNVDPRFGRSRVRTLLTDLAPSGLTVDALFRLADRARRADEALAVGARDASRRHSRAAPEGAAFAADLLDEPAELVLRVLQGVLGNEQAVRYGRLEALVAALKDARMEGRALRRTVGGHQVILSSGLVQLRPEGPRRRGQTRA